MSTKQCTKCLPAATPSFFGFSCSIYFIKQFTQIKWSHNKTIQSVTTEDFIWKHMIQTRKQDKTKVKQGINYLTPFLNCTLSQQRIQGRSPLILVEKEQMKEGRKTSRASKTKPPLPPLAQGLDPRLVRIQCLAWAGETHNLLSPAELIDRLESSNL